MITVASMCLISWSRDVWMFHRSILLRVVEVQKLEPAKNDIILRLDIFHSRIPYSIDIPRLAQKRQKSTDRPVLQA